MSDSKELRTLLECTEILKICFRNNCNDIALFLRKTGIINQERYHEVTDIKSKWSRDEKARMIQQNLEDKVEEDEQNYTVFVRYLASKTRYKKLKKSLYAEYTKQGISINLKVLYFSFKDYNGDVCWLLVIKSAKKFVYAKNTNDHGFW